MNFVKRVLTVIIAASALLSAMMLYREATLPQPAGSTMVFAFEPKGETYGFSHD